MKHFFIKNILFLFFLGTINHSAFSFFDVIARAIGSLKNDIVESVITAKIAAVQPQLLTFGQKGELVRFGGIITFIMALISLFANFIVIFYAFLPTQRRHSKVPVSTIIKIPILLIFISLSLLGVSFSAFWFGEYLINLPESVREFIINK